MPQMGAKRGAELRHSKPGSEEFRGVEAMVRYQDIADTFSVRTSLTGAMQGDALDRVPKDESERGVH
jgi:hypothetical protein